MPSPLRAEGNSLKSLGIHGEIDQETDTDGEMIQVIYIYLYTHKFRRVLTENSFSRGRRPDR